jgi:hypothetical protein
MSAGGQGPVCNLIGLDHVNALLLITRSPASPASLRDSSSPHSVLPASPVRLGFAPDPQVLAVPGRHPCPPTAITEASEVTAAAPPSDDITAPRSRNTAQADGLPRFSGRSRACRGPLQVLCRKPRARDATDCSASLTRAASRWMVDRFAYVPAGLRRAQSTRGCRGCRPNAARPRPAAGRRSARATPPTSAACRARVSNLLCG